MIKSQLNNHWKVYFLTFFAYASMHSMRMSYSLIKAQFKQTFNQTNTFLGLFDGLVYLSLGFGFLFRFLFENKKTLLTTYFICMTIACMAYNLIPLISVIFKEQVKNSVLLNSVLPGFSLLIFGFCQFPAWPTLLTLINLNFDLKKEGTALGIWSANGDIGNIMGFALTGIMVNQLHIRWQFSMLTASCINWITSLMVYKLVNFNQTDLNNQTTQNQNELEWQESIETQDKNINFEQFNKFIKFSKEILSTTENKLYLLSMGLLKSILYGFLLWMPLYLAHQHLNYYKATLLIVFNIGTLIGSFILGYYYQYTPNTNTNHLLTSIAKHLKKYSLFYACIGVTVILTIFYLTKPNILIYFTLSVLGGAFLGGCFNMLASNQVISITEGNKEAVSKLSTLSMVVGNLMVGIVQILIGVVLNIQNSPQAQKNLFFILICISVTAITTLLWRSKILSNNNLQIFQQ